MLAGFPSALVAFESQGVRVFVHGNNTVYDKQIDSFPVTPGYHTEVQLKPVSHYRIDPPHGNCTNVPQVNIYTRDGVSVCHSLREVGNM